MIGWTIDDPFINKNNTKWMVLKEKYIPINIDRNKVWFRLKRNLKKQWYVLCIFHLGLNRFTFGSLKNGKYGFQQGRLVSSGKKRFRVVKINKGKPFVLCLSNLQEDLQIKELLIYPIPSFIAWMKIRNS